LHVETGSTFVYVTHDQMEAMTLATKICLINNGLLQQYAAPLEVYSKPNNLFVADFVGNPSVNFAEANGKQREDGSFDITIFDNIEATFKPSEPVSLANWLHQLKAAAEEEDKQRLMAQQQKDYVEKGNKDEVFKYQIAKVDTDEFAVKEEKVITDDDFVLAIRPEFISISENGAIEGVIYGAMPTGMETTVKVRVGDYLLTGVIFGNALYQIGEKVRMGITSKNINLFHRKSGKYITSGSLEIKK
jgi:multiple sugar transport system ATP-binding protein